VRTSINKKRNGTLASSHPRNKAIELLEGLANLRDDRAGFKRFKKRYPDILRAVDPWLVRHWAMNTEQEDYVPSRPDEELIHKYWLLPLRDTLRRLWRIEDTRTKEWGMIRISQDFFLQGERNLIQVPLASISDLLLTMKPLGPSEQRLHQFLKLASLTRICRNLECDNAPYFVAENGNQKYCSEPCAQGAQRKQKRKWYAKNGKQRRAARSARKT
jgi:hypothetical protein